MHNDTKQGAADALAAKVDALRLAISFFASAVGEQLDEQARQTLKTRLERWADEADMRGAEDLFTETAGLLRLMAVRVGDASVPRI